MRRAASTPLNMVLSVIVTCAVSAAGLTATYAATSDRIAAQEKAAEEKALKSAVPNASKFEPVEQAMLDAAVNAGAETPVSGVFVAISDGESVGWAIRCAPRGYGGPMQMVVGVDRNGKVTGASVITQNETPGLGTKILTEPGFLTQFQGWDASDVDKAAKAFDAISGATKSSSAIRKGVLAAGYVYAEVLSDGGGESK
ncbi:MAG: RnfABCDGE type electron transport complex subunit G [Coriobacteriia bacterium]|nr:RnfABCDGE type electron transport complex subunit G [Coriobacteriia bacterium]